MNIQKRKPNNDLKNLDKWIPNSGINALDLIGTKITATDRVKAEELIKMNFGAEYPKEKFQMLWELIREENWSKERFHQTLKHFLKTKKFPNWTIADFFEYESPRLFPYSKYLLELSKNSNLNNEIEWCKVNDTRFFYYKSENLKIDDVQTK